MRLESIDCPVCRLDDTQDLLRATDINLFRPGKFRP